MQHDAHQHHAMPTEAPVQEMINNHDHSMHMASSGEHGSMGHMMSMAVRQ